MSLEQVLKEGTAAYDAGDFVTAAATLLPLADEGHAEAQYVVANK